jgi:hypothetical protein
MRDRHFLAFAAFVGLAFVASIGACTLDTMGEGTEPVTPVPDSSVGGSGGTQIDAPVKDLSVEEATLPDVLPDKYVPPDTADVEVQDVKGDACFPGTKWCGNDCVITKSPEYGCAQDTCDPCKAPYATSACSNETCAVKTCDPNRADCNGKYDDGCETLTNTLTNCASCGVACAPAHAKGECSDGTTCKVEKCDTGYEDCDAQHGNGCEVFTDGDPKNCGLCGNVCQPPTTNDTMKCTAGVCLVDICAAGTADCDSEPNTCEVDTTSDVNNCGVCGKACTFSNGIGACVNGVCKMTGCVTPFGNCDGQEGNGCEVDLKSSVSHCGSCAAMCKSTNGSAPACNEGLCTLTCNTGYLNCNGAGPGASPLNDGCETQVDAQHCGSCTGVCSTTNGTPTCSAGQCVMTCQPEWLDCNGPAVAGTPNDDGCQTHRATDVNNCGACGTKCNSINGGPTCTNGVCGISCNSGWSNCNVTLTDGCEVNTAADPQRCGSCTKTCNNTNGTATCSAGVCGITCNPGFGNCDGNADNGCETNLLTTFLHCGACNAACMSSVDGHGTSVCDNGACKVSSCISGYGNCDGNAANACETQTMSSVQHCGQCLGGCNGNCPLPCTVPNATPVCTAGACAIGACTGAWKNCDNQTTNGCEVNTATDPNNCGQCGHACSSINGTGSCALGSCSIQCSAGWGNCDSNLINGCETPTTDDPLHCGSCNPCEAGTNPNGTLVCTGTTCGIVCSTGFGNCNNKLNDGCEVALTSTANCGACGNVCSSTNGTATCSSGVCTISCNTSYLNCDGNAANGCEVNSGSDPNNCGNCGNVCTNPKPNCLAGKCST